MKLTKILSLILVAVLGIGALASCNLTEAVDEASGDAITYVSLRINPEIELLADEDGKVITASAVNEDGEILLCAVDLEGMSVEDAGALFTETANELGYLDPEGERDTVYVDVQSADAGEETDELREKLDKSIRDYFNNKGINGKVSEETLDKYAERAEEWGLSTGHTKLVMRVLDANPELTDTDVVGLSVKELMNLLKGNGKEDKITAGLKNAYRTEVEALKEKYARLFELRAEIDDIEEQLEGELDDEERKALEDHLIEKENEMKPLRDAYKNELSALKKAYKQKSREARKIYRDEAERRIKEKKSLGAQASLTDI